MSRVKWGLQYDYPMVAPSYARKRGRARKGDRARSQTGSNAQVEAQAAEKGQGRLNAAAQFSPPLDLRRGLGSNYGKGISAAGAALPTRLGRG